MRRRKRSVAMALWLLAAAALAALGWFWFWTSGTDRPQKILSPGPSNPQSGSGQPSGLATTGLLPRAPSPTALASPRPETSAVPAQVRVGPAPNTPETTLPRSPNLITDTTPALLTPASYPRAVQNVFELQVALARVGISPGSIDGLLGNQTRSALKRFQQKEHLATTGELDNLTRERLLLSDSSTTAYVVTSNDLARLQPLSPTWLGKSQQTALEYETLLELVSEKGRANPALVRRLNPGVDWSKVAACTQLELPNVTCAQPKAPAAFLTIRLNDKVLEAWDEQTNLVAHFPCSIARQVEKRPVGELHVWVIAPHPNYTFDPEIFPESSEARELKTKLVLPPGPNNPVGSAWIGLDKPGYGIHGTPSPEQVGRTESHGCFRLANWNAEALVRLVVLGTPVYIQP